jgi:hypothetical protein
VIGAPESQGAGREIELSFGRWQWRRQVAGLFLPEVVAHLERKRQHLYQRPGCCVVGQLGGGLAPGGGNQNAFLCHCRSDQSERDDESFQQ